MSIHDLSEKIKFFWTEKIGRLISQVRDNFDIKEDTFIILTIILIGLAGFGLGKLSAQEKSREVIKIEPLTKSTTTPTITTANLPTINGNPGLLVASKNGTKYHFPWCAGALQISEKNKIWFNSYTEAQTAGYTPASNCPNLK